MALLVKYDSNWADEMDVAGFYVTTREKWNDYVERVRRHFEGRSELTYYIGTNEEICYERVEDLLRDFTLVDITDEQAETLRTLFQSWGSTVSFGFTGPDVD
jgi:hypothetical protein